jgi:hypothetical protein
MTESEPIVPVEQSERVEEAVEDDTTVTGVPGFDARAEDAADAEEPGAGAADDPEFREPS